MDSARDSADWREICCIVLKENFKLRDVIHQSLFRKEEEKCIELNFKHVIFAPHPIEISFKNYTD